MLDAHAHLGDINYKNAVLCTSTMPTVEELSLLKSYPIYCVGQIPPNNSIESLASLPEFIKDGARVGEIGLDRRFEDLPMQIKSFRFCLEIAKAFNIRPVIHTVGCPELTYKLIKEVKLDGFMIHGYASSFDMARRFEKLGGLISLPPRAERCKDFKKLLTLYFVTETDMQTGKEEEETLKNWNIKLSELTGKDIESISENRIRNFFNA